MSIDRTRFDRIARTVGTRRTFVAALAAIAAGLIRLRPAGAQGFCSTIGGFCTPGTTCCPGHVCTFEFNVWVGRCARITDDGGMSPIDSNAQVWARRITNRASVRAIILERRREQRRQRRRRDRR